MSSSPAGSTTPFSDYTSPRSNRGLTPVDTTRVLEVYVLKNSADPVLVLVPIARAGNYSDFWNVVKNDLYPGNEHESDIAPMIYLLDPFMTRLRLDLWSDLLPSLRGKRLLVLPGDAAPPPTHEDPKSPSSSSKRSSWTSPTPKSTPTIPETTRITVDALTQRTPWSHLTPTTPSPPPPPPQRPKPKPEDRSVSFSNKTPDFAFDIALWCRFAPSFKPSLLMHFQFREIVVQAVPRPTGLEVRALKNRIASALTNMLRRQGCLGTLTSRPMADFGDLLVRGEALALALEDWPSCRESLGITEETLRWVAEPVLLYCEIQSVDFPGREVGRGRGRGGGGVVQGRQRAGSVVGVGGKVAGRGRGRGRGGRTVEVESASEDEVD